MALSSAELTEDLEARSDLSQKDASAVVYTISRAVEAATGQLVTNDRLDARLSDLKGDLKGEIASLRTELKGEAAALRTEVKGDIANLRVEMHSLVRTQTAWMVGLLTGVIGIAVAIIKLFP